jgi:nicotinamide-nucleotide amidase
VIVEVLVVGDEIVSGATADTNSGAVARALFEQGYCVSQVTQVGDRAADITRAAREAMQRARVLVVSGGLGPTPDDLTKETFAALFDDPLQLDEATLDEIRQRFARRGLVMSEANRKQALLPRSGRKIPNPLGSAPGVHWARSDCDVFLLPGVPPELRRMLLDDVVPHVAALEPAVRPRLALLRTVGLPESQVAERVHLLEPELAGMRLGFYPSRQGVDVKLLQEGATTEAFEAGRRALQQALGDVVYAQEPGMSLEAVLQRLFVERGWRLTVAESCTGGLLGARLTHVPGSSDFFVGGFVTYADRAKEEWLRVSPALLGTYGAVSAEVAVAMARGALERANADVSLAITGIAGPSGGTEEKPVGLVYLALATHDACWTRRLQLGAWRALNRELACMHALDMLRRLASGQPQGEKA